KRTAARRRSGSAPRDRASATAFRAWRPAKIPGAPAVSWPRPPVQIGAHAGPQLRHLVDRIGADREGAKVEIAGGTCRAPARIFALGGDQLHLDSDAAVAERRNTDVEAVADLERLDQVLPEVEVDPQVVEIDQRHQRNPGRDIFAGLHVALVDLR